MNVGLPDLPQNYRFDHLVTIQVAVLCKGTSLGFVLKTTECNVLTLSVSLSQDM